MHFSNVKDQISLCDRNQQC